MGKLFQLLMQRLTAPDAKDQLFQQKIASGMRPDEATRQIYGPPQDIYLPPTAKREGGLLPQLIKNFSNGAQAASKFPGSN